MKMVMVVYNEAVDADVMESLETCCLQSYTKVAGVFGRGDASGTHLGTDVWPGLNNILYVACDEKQAAFILDRVKELRKTLAQEGVKAFVWDLSGVC